MEFDLKAYKLINVLLIFFGRRKRLCAVLTVGSAAKRPRCGYPELILNGWRGLGTEGKTSFDLTGRASPS